MSNITWGVCRAPDGSPLRTVFCLDCREVFGRYLTGIEHMDVLEQAKATHSCPTCTTAIESKQEEKVITWFGHCAQCEVQAIQYITHATNKA